jgi:hypothetical protein
MGSPRLFVRVVVEPTEFAQDCPHRAQAGFRLGFTGLTATGL